MQNENITIDGRRLYRDGELLGTFETEAGAWTCKHALDEVAKPNERAVYWHDVRDMAESIKAELQSQIDDGTRGEDLRDWLIEHIHESIDGSARVMYTRQAQECLAYSENDGAYFEEFGDEGAVSDGAINWSALAYMAFRRDVEAQLEADGVDLNEPDPACEECECKGADVVKRGEGDGARWLCDSCHEDEDEDGAEVAK